MNSEGKSKAISALAEHIQRTSAFISELARCYSNIEVKKLMLEYNDILDILDKIVDFDAILDK